MSRFSDGFRESLGGHPEEMKMPPRPPIHTSKSPSEAGMSANIDRTGMMAQSSATGDIEDSRRTRTMRPDFVATSQMRMIEGAKENGPLPDVSHLPRDERNASADHVDSNWMRERRDHRKGAYTGYVRMPSVGDMWVR